jgi:glycerate dehydrogenase
MKIVLMESDSLGRDVSLSPFYQLGEVTAYGTSDEFENPIRIKDADIIVLNKIPVNEALIGDAKNLKLICLTATGTNNIDFVYTNKRGIPVANVSGYSTESVVQHTFAMLFYLYEHLPYYDNYVKSGAYSESKTFSFFGRQFNELSGKTWGIIGLGNIGRRVADIASFFGCNVIYYSTSGRNNSEKYARKELDELLKSSDIVSIHCPLNAKTQNLISVRELELMKSNAIILNLGRGKIIDEKALFDALTKNQIMAAGLDVISEEPILPDNPLMQIKDSNKLLITPHIGWGTIEARQRCVEEVCKNIQAFYAGEKRNIVIS